MTGGGSLSKVELATGSIIDILEGDVKSKAYLNICDFDDHFDNAENDWSNKHIKA